MNDEAKKTNEQPKKGELITIEINQAKKAGMNMLLPSTHIENMSEFHSPILDYVELSPELAAGDVYYHAESKKLVPSKQGLMKLAVCAGIVWHPTETRRTDNRQERDYVSYQATGGVRKADGQMVWLKAEFDMDFEVIREELQNQYRATGKKNNKSEKELQEYVDYCVKRDLLYRRKHKLKLCEAGSMTRVIRSLLGLKAGYTAQELKKPFCVARITFRPDYSDPEIRKIMVKKSIESITNIYGGGSGIDDISEQILSPPIEIPHEDIIDCESEYPETEDLEPEQNEKEDLIAHKKADFLADDKKGQANTLKTLSGRKGYDLNQLKKPLEKFTDSELEGFFDLLMGRPDSDSPF